MIFKNKSPSLVAPAVLHLLVKLDRAHFGGERHLLSFGGMFASTLCSFQDCPFSLSVWTPHVLRRWTSATWGKSSCSLQAHKTLL